MKITRLEAIPVNVPLKPDLTTKTAHGEHVDSPYVIVRLHTDEGLCGLGEATLAARWSGETSPGCVAVLRGLVEPVLLGEDPRDLNRLRLKIDSVIRHNPFTRAAVEMALWDLAGKAAGVSVCRLLGGPVRSEVPMKMVIGGFPVEKAVSLARRFLAAGIRCLKVKVGIDEEQDFARFQAVREVAGPEIPIGIDANCGWDPATARRMLRRLEPLGVLFAEQPIPVGDPEAMAALRQHTGIPLMADESIFTLNDAWQLSIDRAADVLAVYPGKHGGIAATAEIVAVARAGGMRCSIGSNLELGVGTAAMLQVAAALPGIDSEAFPADLLGPLYHESDLLTEPLALGPAAATLPERPGLGVELDDEQLERYRDPSDIARSLG